jgi:hypothetical protein
MQVAPARFRHPIDAPEPVADRYYRRFLGVGAGAPRREQADLLASALFRGDPLMDAWVERAQTLDPRQAHALFERALTGGIHAIGDGPSELIALFRQLSTVPLWVDGEAIELGARTARRAGPVAGAVLSSFSLMGGYRSSAVVKPLMMTGKLRYEASKRLTETGRFVIAITEPGALRLPREGFRAAVRVRHVHARIRHHLARSPEWNAAEWGLPINQADMLGTNLLFSLGFLMGGRALGLSFREEEAASVVHVWRYVGYLLGIDENLLPANEREAQRIMYLVGASQPPADADSVVLARALHEEPLERAKTERARRFARVEMAIRGSISRFLLGDEVADELALPKSRMRFGVRGIAPLVSAFEKARKNVPFGDELAYRLGSYWIKTAIAERSEQAAVTAKSSSRESLHETPRAPAVPSRPRSPAPPTSLNGAI